MRILDRYTLRPLVFIFIGCIFVFLFLYVIIDVLSHLDDILKNKTALEVLAVYYLTYLPVMFVEIAPFACLLSTLYTYATLNQHNEIIAMRSSGLSIFQVTKTAILFGIIISLFVFWVNDRILPLSMKEHQRIEKRMESVNVPEEPRQPEVIKNLSMYGLRNRLFFINTFYPRKAVMEGIIILEHDTDQDVIKKIVANRAVYEEDIWKFYESITYLFDKSGRMIGNPKYQQEEIMVIPETPADFYNQQQHAELMSITQLDDYIWRLSRSGATGPVRTLQVELYQRFTTPFTSVIIVLLGIPFALKIKRKATGLSSFGIAMMVAFVYYILDAVCVAFGKGGTIPPILGATLSHIIALIIGVSLIASMA